MTQQTGQAPTLNDFLSESHAAFVRKSASRPEPAPKTCTVCGATFSRKPTESRATYRRRTTCSEACAIELKRRRSTKHDHPDRLPQPHRQPVRRWCAFCGAPLVQHEQERPSQFAVRRTCNRSCGAQLRWSRAGTRIQTRTRRSKRVSDEELDRRAEIILARMAA